MSLENMRYDANTGTLIYRSKMHLGLKRNFRRPVHRPIVRGRTLIVHNSR